MKDRSLLVSVLVVLVLMSASLACGPLGGGTAVAPEPAAQEQAPEEAAQPASPPTPTPVPPAPEPTAIPPTEPPPPPRLAILVVSDDFASGRTDWSSGTVISETLNELGYPNNYWSTKEDGFPLASDLEAYDLVFWSTGDDCCDTPNADAVRAMSAFVDGGGWLFLDGGSIGYAWANSSFMKNYLHADHTGWNVQADIVPADHPIAAGLGNEPIRFSRTPFVPDTIRPRDGAEVVFTRGPQSAARGQPTMIAYDDGEARIVYAAFPLFLLPDNVITTILQNSMDWFSRP